MKKSLFLLLALASVSQATAQDRAPAIEYSDGYYTRLTVHRVGSYAMLPLFGSEYLLGRKLMGNGDVAGWVQPTHVAVAAGIGALFAVNTVTGALNLWESRHEKEGRNRRILHAALMTLADAGFGLTALLADDDGGNLTAHRNAAFFSIGLSTAGTLVMWIGD